MTSRPAIDTGVLASLVDDVIEAAKRELGRRGAFYPHAESLSADGRRTTHTASVPLEERRGLYRALHESMRAQAAAGSLTAIALAANVAIPDDYRPQFPFGIRVHVEAPGYARFVYQPYRLEPRSIFEWILRRRPVTFGEAFTVEVSPTFFGDRPDAPGAGAGA